MLTFPPVFDVMHTDSRSVTKLSAEVGGNWTCRITKLTKDGNMQRVAAGTLDIVQAGDYFVGCARCEGIADVPPSFEAVDVPTLGIEGPVFGAVRGDRVVLWVTEVFGQALWVMEGTIASSGIVGTAVYTDTEAGTGLKIQARFGMRRS